MSDEVNEFYSACDCCRTRKYKCTKERPACAPCLQLGLACNYSRKASRTPLTRSNLTAAENRIQDLETALKSLFPGVDIETVLLSTIRSSENPNRNTKIAVTSSDKPSTSTKDASHEAESTSESLPQAADGFDWTENAVSLSELTDGMAALSVNPEGAGYLGATSSVVPLRALLDRERNVAQQDFSASEGWHPQSMFSDQLPMSLPFSNISETTFVDAYFRCYHTTYPFLHEPLFRALVQGKSPRPDRNSWIILYNAVLAIGAWCIGDDDSVMDDFFYRKVAQFSEESSIFESGNLAMVQGLLLLSNYAQKRNRPNTGWNYLGLAVRMALSLGLHKEFPNWEITPLQREMRRRVWWGLFIFDSGASITFGRPVLLPESGIMDASTVLNIHEESLTPHTTLLPDEIPQPTIYTALISQSLFHFSTNSLHHRLISTPYPLPEELLVLNQTIDSWENSIPSYFQLDSPVVQSNETFLFARYRLSWRSWNLQIILFRPVVLQLAARRKQSESSTISETSEELECREKCIQSARATINSISDFVATGMVSRLSTWYMLYFLFQAGLVPIICLLTDPAHTDSGIWLNDIRTARDLLNRTALTNRLAARCLAVFNRLSPAIDNVQSEDLGLGMWEGNFADEFLNDQFGGDMGVWDWENGEVNWRL